MTKRNLTILDVAREAQVSTATVSRALNGGKVSARAQRRVQRAVEALGYQRNTLARGLVTGKTGVVGVLVPDVLGPLYAQMARGIEDVLTPLGMQYTLVTSSRDVAREAVAVRFLLEHQMDGLILIGAQMPTGAMQSLLGGRAPVVLVQREALPDAEPAPPDVPIVGLDNAHGVAAAMRYLLEAGHRHIAHVAGARLDGAARLRAYGRALDEAGVSARYVLEGDSTEASGVRAGAALAEHRAKYRAEYGEVSAVFCANDRVALGLYHALHERGLRVPDDMSVVGFDDLPWSAFLGPPLTTVRQPGQEMGALAARRLLEALQGDAAPRTTLVEPELVVRASVRPLRGGEAT